MLEEIKTKIKDLQITELSNENCAGQFYLINTQELERIDNLTISKTCKGPRPSDKQCLYDGKQHRTSYKSSVYIRYRGYAVNTRTTGT